LGGSAHDGEELFLHPFFASIDWLSLLRKEVEPPFKPEVESENDLRNIDPELLSESKNDSRKHLLEAVDVFARF